MTRKTAVLLLLLLLALSVFATRTDEVTLHPPDRAIPAKLFGMHIHHAATYTPWPAVRFEVWRLWGSYSYWSRLEPKKDKWDFNLLDKYVDLAEQHHVEVLLTLGITPEWASSHPSEKSDYGPGGSAIPKNMADWQNYVRTVATRYKGRIHEYEIWNEPNLRNYYAGSVPQMVQLARVAYQTLKKVDPTITACSPSATGPPGAEWLDQYLKDGGGKYADVIGYHFYVNPAPPEEMLPLIQQVEQIMRNDGVGNKPLWNTETGWAIQNNTGSVKPAPGHGFNSIVLSQNQAAAYLARAYVLSWASGVSRLYWYAWDNGVMGLVEPDGKTLKPPAIAYGQVENWLVGATMTSCGSNSKGIWTCALTRPGNYRAWIVWDPDRTVSFPVPTAWKVNEIRDLTGGSRALRKTKAIHIGPLPILLVSPGS